MWITTSNRTISRIIISRSRTTISKSRITISRSRTAITKQVNKTYQIAAKGRRNNWPFAAFCF